MPKVGTPGLTKLIAAGLMLAVPFDKSQSADLSPRPAANRATEGGFNLARVRMVRKGIDTQNSTVSSGDGNRPKPIVKMSAAPMDLNIKVNK